MSSLRAKIDRGRSQTRDPIIESSEDDNADVEGEAKKVDYYEEIKPKIRSSPKKKSPVKKKMKAVLDEEELAELPSSDESEPEPKDDDDDYQEGDDDEDESFDEGDDEDLGKTSKKRKAAPAKKHGRLKAKKTPRAPSRARKPVRKYDSADESSNHDEEESEEQNTAESKPRNDAGEISRSSQRSQRASRVTKTYVDKGSSDSEFNDSESDESSYLNQSVSTPFSTSRARASAAKATAKINQLRYRQDKEAAEDKDDDSQDDDESNFLRKTKPKRRNQKKADSDDEEFRPGDEIQENDDATMDSEFVDFSADDSIDIATDANTKKTNFSIGKVDDNDFGADEQSDSSDDDDYQNNIESAQQSPLRRKSATANDHFDSDSDAEIKPTPTKARLSREERSTDGQLKIKSRPILSLCPSTHDVITAEPLPHIHVCFIVPDGKSRHCFALETLHKIATASQHPQYRKDYLSNEKQLTFLQPPHFRSAMSDELLDQVASRFGRAALDLNGDFYKRRKISKVTTKVTSTSSDDEENDGNTREYFVNFTEAHDDSAGFMENLNEFMVRSMGSQDVYPCPLCYCVAHHRIAESRNVQKIEIPHEFLYDPMTVLGSVDNDDFDIAAAFCFKRISQVKQHLRQDHQCKTANIDNQVFMRYKVRTQDGLLQRFLANDRTYGRTKQGDMRRYWYDGNSARFNYLLYHMQHPEYYREHPLQRSGLDDDNPLEAAEVYFRSFQDQAENLWRVIVSPFSKSTGDDLNDFLADDSDEESEKPSAHFNFDRKEAAADRQYDEALAARYRQMAGEICGSYRSSDDEVSEQDDVYIPEGMQDDSESEEDYWIAGIRNKKWRTSMKTPEKKRKAWRKVSVGISKESQEDSDSDVASMEQALEAPSNSTKKASPSSSKKRVIPEDSD